LRYLQSGLLQERLLDKGLTCKVAKGYSLIEGYNK